MKWLAHFGSLNALREKQLAQVKTLQQPNIQPLISYLSTPFPRANTPIAQLPLVALDFETTGLNAKNDKLLSVGCLDISQQLIKLNTCYHQVINCDQTLSEDNIVIHQITEQEKQQGAPLAEVITKLLAKLTGKVILAHYAKIEVEFLKQACQVLYGFSPSFPVIDTLHIAKKKLDKTHQDYDGSMLRLTNLRQQYQLPQHFSHNALNDALATAELFLALTVNDHGSTFKQMRSRL